MMLKKIATLLATKPGISDWKIIERRERGQESYLRGDKIELSRAKDVIRWDVTVYVDSRESAEGKLQELRGEASTRVVPGMEEAEICALLDRAAATASKSRNPHYAIAEGRAASPTRLKTSTFDVAPSGQTALGSASQAGPEETAAYWSDALIRELAAVPRGAHSRYAALELFLGREDLCFLNSKGLERSGSRWNGMLEFVATAGTSPTEEVELYRSERFSDHRPGSLAAMAAERFSQASDRLKAAPLELKEPLPVLFAGEALASLMEYWLFHLSASSVYRKTSKAVVGKPLQAEGPGDRISIALSPDLEGAPDDSPFDEDGVVPIAAELMRDGVAMGYSAPLRWAQYMGCPITGASPCARFSGGSANALALRSGRYLEPVVFSDFFVDSVSGDFGGEIRLAYLVDGDKKWPFTGGSIAGNLGEGAGKLALARETERVGNLIVPTCALLEGVSVTNAI